MTSDALLILKTVFISFWRLFASWYIPGTHTTPAAWFLYLSVAGLSLRFISRVTFSRDTTNQSLSDRSGKS